ncbi:hypothetical protein ACWEP4_24020 [Streptomyces sp. NPDC004227]
MPMWEPSEAELQLLQEVFVRAAAEFGCQTVDGDRAEGWRGRTLGGKVTANGLARWLRVVAAPADKVSGKLWMGNESAQVIAGASRPELVEVRDWAEEELRFRAELSTFVEDAPVSMTPELQGPVQLPESWWKGLETSLEAMAATATDRVSVRQDLVNRRLEWISGGRIDPEVAVWKASHGDLHWANLTAPTCVLLDWEGWGLAPAGWDVAALRAYSTCTRRSDADDDSCRANTTPIVLRLSSAVPASFPTRGDRAHCRSLTDAATHPAKPRYVPTVRPENVMS